MVTWIGARLGIAATNELPAYSPDTIFLDARAYFDNGGKPDWWGIHIGVTKLIEHNILEYNRQVIIFCDGGIDRSPYVAAKALMDMTDMSLGEAYGLIKKYRPHIIEHYEWED